MIIPWILSLIVNVFSDGIGLLLLDISCRCSSKSSALTSRFSLFFSNFRLGCVLLTPVIATYNYFYIYVNAELYITTIRPKLSNRTIQGIDE